MKKPTHNRHARFHDSQNSQKLNFLESKKNLNQMRTRIVLAWLWSLDWSPKRTIASSSAMDAMSAGMYELSSSSYFCFLARLCGALSHPKLPVKRPRRTAPPRSRPRRTPTWPARRIPPGCSPSPILRSNPPSTSKQTLETMPHSQT